MYIYKPTIYQHSRLPGKKKKKPCQEQEIKISRITARGKKRKNIIGQKKKRKGQLRHPS